MTSERYIIKTVVKISLEWPVSSIWNVIYFNQSKITPNDNITYHFSSDGFIFLAIWNKYLLYLRLYHYGILPTEQIREIIWH